MADVTYLCIRLASPVLLILQPLVTYGMPGLHALRPVVGNQGTGLDPVCAQSCRQTLDHHQQGLSRLTIFRQQAAARQLHVLHA